MVVSYLDFISTSLKCSVYIIIAIYITNYLVIEFSNYIQPSLDFSLFFQILHKYHELHAKSYVFGININRLESFNDYNYQLAIALAITYSLLKVCNFLHNIVQSLLVYYQQQCTIMVNNRLWFVTAKHHSVYEQKVKLHKKILYKLQLLFVKVNTPISVDDLLNPFNHIQNCIISYSYVQVFMKLNGCYICKVFSSYVYIYSYLTIK